MPAFPQKLVFMGVGHTIAKYRKQKGLKQWELAELVGVSQSYVARWETNRVNPRMSAIEKVAEALEIPVEQLLLDEKGMMAGIHIDDEELVDMLAQLPKLDERELDALKVFLNSILTRHQIEETLRR